MNIKLEPVYNPYQYLTVFIVGVFIDLIIHFLSSRKYYALKTGTDTFGIAPELMVYYRSLSRKGPFPIGETESFTNNINSWLMGALIAGILCTLVVIISDIVLQCVKWKQS